jgi:hypothetical protein
MPDIERYAIAQDDRLVLLAGDRLYVMTADVDHREDGKGSDHLISLATCLLSIGSASALCLSSLQTYPRDSKLLDDDRHTWKLDSDVLDEALIFSVANPTPEDNAYALWCALTGMTFAP